MRLKKKKQLSGEELVKREEKRKELVKREEIISKVEIEKNWKEPQAIAKMFFIFQSWEFWLLIASYLPTLSPGVR